MDRLAVASTLREIGLLLGLEKGNRFRARAYERGARALESAGALDLDALAQAGRLTAIPGIGRALAGTIAEVRATGRSTLLERLRRRFPPGAIELGSLLSLRRIQVLHEALGIVTLAQLREACEAGRIRRVPGFGIKTERRLLERIADRAARGAGVLLPEADRQAEIVCAHLRAHTDVRRIEIAGALRRRVEAVDRVELVACSTAPTAVATHAARLPSTLAPPEDLGDRIVVRRAGALDVHLNVSDEGRFAAAWLHATGSDAHVAALSRRARERGLVLDQNGLRGGTDATPHDEAGIYARLGMAFVPPELREGAGEIEAATDGTLPDDLVRLDDIRGAVHCHTTYSDGRNTVEEMARAADALGLDYLTITDHSASAGYARGLEIERLRRQWDEIARVQEGVRVRLLRGTESDILRDGALDYPDAILAELDVVVASIHNRHGMDARQMTRRLERAMRHPRFKIWGHALGRYVLSRPPFACDVERVLDVIAGSRAAIEVNGDPHRLDLEPRWLRAARRRGIRFVVSADAHSTAALRNLRFGVDMARRGWLRRADVLNTLDVEAFAAAVRP